MCSFCFEYIICCRVPNVNRILSYLSFGAKCQIEAKLELRLDHIERDERLNVFDREELRFNLFREVFEETALELKVLFTGLK